MGVAAQFLFGKVMHARLFPRKNRFNYSIYYMALALSKLDELSIPYNRFGLLSFYDRDHGAYDGSNLEQWARDILAAHNIDHADGEITLICMPRVLGYVFNPVSFWLCHDKAGDIRAVLCEVHNTFGERHTYLCAHEDQRPIQRKDVLQAQKIFHVSPFMEREGHYTFRFDIDDQQFKTWIDFYDADHKKKLVTSLAGEYAPLNTGTRRKAFWAYPLVTLKATMLIHWQAMKILAKGIKYISKPIQKKQRITTTDGISENNED